MTQSANSTQDDSQPLSPGEVNQATRDFQVLVNEGRDTFFSMMRTRHEMGQEEYGPVKFMEVNTLVEAGEELVDMANYTMYTFIKLYVLNKQIARIVAEGPDTLGAQSFMKG